MIGKSVMKSAGQVHGKTVLQSHLGSQKGAARAQEKGIHNHPIEGQLASIHPLGEI